MSDPGSPDAKARLIEVTLDEASIRRTTADIDHERKIAIFDLIEDNHFRLASIEGPYCLRLSIEESRLVFTVGDSQGQLLNAVMLSLTPFRKIIKDYFFICESYYQAIKTAPPSRIEALDMGRRGLHDEGSRLLMERLTGKIEMDFPTSRRLFTLICVLHWKG